MLSFCVVLHAVGEPVSVKQRAWGKVQQLLQAMSSPFASNPLVLYNDFVLVEIYIFQLCKYVWKTDITSFTLHICVDQKKWCSIGFQFAVVVENDLHLLADGGPWMMESEGRVCSLPRFSKAFCQGKIRPWKLTYTTES